jgi:hypothetical protein
VHGQGPSCSSTAVRHTVKCSGSTCSSHRCKKKRHSIFNRVCKQLESCVYLFAESSSIADEALVASSLAAARIVAVWSSSSQCCHRTNSFARYEHREQQARRFCYVFLEAAPTNAMLLGSYNIVACALRQSAQFGAPLQTVTWLIGSCWFHSSWHIPRRNTWER